MAYTTTKREPHKCHKTTTAEKDERWTTTYADDSRETDLQYTNLNGDAHNGRKQTFSNGLLGDGLLGSGAHDDKIVNRNAQIHLYAAKKIVALEYQKHLLWYTCQDLYDAIHHLSSILFQQFGLIYCEIIGKSVLSSA